jgi:hypothetical protein
LAAGRDRRAPSELAELLPRLTDGQVQEIGKLRHMARLPWPVFRGRISSLHGVLSDAVSSEQIYELGSLDENQWPPAANSCALGELCRGDQDSLGGRD